MQGKDTIISTFHQLFGPIFTEKFQQEVEKMGVDKYTKKLHTIQLIELIAHAQLEQHGGLRDISHSLNDDKISEAIGLDSISASQISRKLRELPTKVLQMLFNDVKANAVKEIGVDTVSQGLRRLRLIDSTTISLCLSQFLWAKFRKTKGGIKIHLGLRFFEQGVLPDEVVITPAKPADKTQMDALVVEEEDALNVFDRGYVDYKKFDNYCQKGIRFVTRLKGNAVIEVVKDLPKDPADPIKKHQIVYLGTEGINKMKHPLRLVETEDTQGNPVIIITNDFKLEAEEISAIYRYRWQIELFFKWIKQHLRIKHFYGTSEQAVENQIFIALITYCLLVLMKLKVGYRGPLLTIKRLLHTCLCESFKSFVQKLYRLPQRGSKGRRRMNHEAIYQATVRQVMAGETDHLNDLAYDPVIL
ncbi:IS4 family transposase [Thermovenabulum sp.]|uniref:IS4 family transposase n=1 Tax=Thermovenabulum sp. TaxID=3100335 RepID=UPI003C79E09A